MSGGGEVHPDPNPSAGLGQALPPRIKSGAGSEGEGDGSLRDLHPSLPLDGEEGSLR